jgi:hypothetical protein
VIRGAKGRMPARQRRQTKEEAMPAPLFSLVFVLLLIIPAVIGTMYFPGRNERIPVLASRPGKQMGRRPR